MKRFVTYLALATLLFACSEKEEDKPKNLIPEDKMKEILYDLNLLQTISNTNYQAFQSANVNPEIYIYKKYSIDSLQFALSNKYYLKNVEKYEKMLDEIAERINKEKQNFDAANSGNSDQTKDTLKADKK